MNIVQITPGAGGMYCGNCFRDNALVAALRRMGHETLMVPLYLPMTLEEENSSQGTPIFFSGINVYLEQKSSLFRRMPNWLHRILASPVLLKWASGRAAKTKAAHVGDLTLSMLRGEEGNQARELDELVGWLQAQEAPQIVCLSNAMLMGMVRQIKARLSVPVVCMLQGEDSFLNGLPDEFREEAWATLAERAREVDMFVAPSRYFAELMTHRLQLDPGRVKVVYNGINLEGFGMNRVAGVPGPSGNPPVLGYFARMCPEKGLDTLVEAFIRLRQRNRVLHLKLRVGGGCGPSDKAFVRSLQARLQAKRYLSDVEFLPNLDRQAKQEFFRSLTVMSVPALYGEAFGLYVLESLASGVPVVQPRHGAFEELVEATGGGVLCEPGSPEALADAIESLLQDSAKLKQMAARGKEMVRREFSIDTMAGEMVRHFESLLVGERVES